MSIEERDQELRELGCDWVDDKSITEAVKWELFEAIKNKR